MQFRLLLCPELLLLLFDMKNIQIKIKRTLVLYGFRTCFFYVKKPPITQCFRALDAEEGPWT